MKIATTITGRLGFRGMYGGPIDMNTFSPDVRTHFDVYTHPKFPYRLTSSHARVPQLSLEVYSRPARTQVSIAQRGSIKPLYQHWDWRHLPIYYLIRLYWTKIGEMCVYQSGCVYSVRVHIYTIRQDLVREKSV